jgi:hypothetical protein
VGFRKFYVVFIRFYSGGGGGGSGGSGGGSSVGGPSVLPWTT